MPGFRWCGSLSLGSGTGGGIVGASADIRRPARLLVLGRRGSGVRAISDLCSCILYLREDRDLYEYAPIFIAGS